MARFLTPRQRLKLGGELEKALYRDPDDGLYKYREGMTDAIFAMKHKALFEDFPGDRVIAIKRLRQNLFGAMHPPRPAAPPAAEPVAAPAAALVEVQLSDMRGRLKDAAGFVREMRVWQLRHARRLRGIEKYLITAAIGSSDDARAVAAEVRGMVGELQIGQPAAAAPPPPAPAKHEPAKDYLQAYATPEPVEASPRAVAQTTGAPTAADYLQAFYGDGRRFTMADAQVTLHSAGWSRGTAASTLVKGWHAGKFERAGDTLWRVVKAQAAEPAPEPPKLEPEIEPEGRGKVSAHAFIYRVFKRQGRSAFIAEEAANIIAAHGWDRSTAHSALANGEREGLFVRGKVRGQWRINPNATPPASAHANRSAAQIRAKRVRPGEPTAAEYLVALFRGRESFTLKEAEGALESAGWNSESAGPTLVKGNGPLMFARVGRGTYRVIQQGGAPSPMLEPAANDSGPRGFTGGPPDMNIPFAQFLPENGG